MGGIKQGKSLEKVLFSVIKKGRPNVVADKVYATEGGARMDGNETVIFGPRWVWAETFAFTH